MHTLASTFGRPDLTRTVVDGAVDMTRYLLAHKADPNARLRSKVHKRVYNPGDGRLGEGATPLMRAARGGDALIFRMLLDAGADPNLEQKSRVGLILLAAGVRGQAGNSNPEFGTETSAAEVVKMCLDHGLDVNQESETRETPIHAAVGSPGLIRLLAERGARLDTKNRRGQTPFEAAAQSLEPGNPSLELLRELTGSK
jgi:ankyrin repeat protein